MFFHLRAPSSENVIILLSARGIFLLVLRDSVTERSNSPVSFLSPLNGPRVQEDQLPPKRQLSAHRQQCKPAAGTGSPANAFGSRGRGTLEQRNTSSSFAPPGGARLEMPDPPPPPSPCQRPPSEEEGEAGSPSGQNLMQFYDGGLMDDSVPSPVLPGGGDDEQLWRDEGVVEGMEVVEGQGREGALPSDHCLPSSRQPQGQQQRGLLGLARVRSSSPVDRVLSPRGRRPVREVAPGRREEGMDIAEANPDHPGVVGAPLGGPQGAQAHNRELAHAPAPDPPAPRGRGSRQVRTFLAPFARNVPPSLAQEEEVCSGFQPLFRARVWLHFCTAFGGAKVLFFRPPHLLWQEG